MKTNYLVKIILIAFSILKWNATYAQKYSIEHGKEFTTPTASKWGGFSGENQDNFFILRIKTKGRGTNYFIECISKQNREKTYEVELPLEKEVKGGLDPAKLNMRLICANDRIFIFFKGQSSEKTQYYMKTLFTNGKLGDLVELINTSENISLDFYQSPDKTKILIMQTNPWIDDRQSVEATMYEASTFEKLWRKNLPSEFKSSPIETYYYNVDNSGNLYFLLNYLESDEPRIIGMGMGLLGAKTEKAKMIVLPNKNHYKIENGRAIISADGKMIVSGLYKNELTPDESKMQSMNKKEKAAYEWEVKKNNEVGVFSFIIDNTTLAITSDFKKFPEEVSKKLAYASGLLTEGAGNKFYAASKLEEIAGEFYLIENHRYGITSGGSTYAVEREFIITKINKQGTIAWTKVYPKNTGGELITFNVLINSRKLHLFYLEHPKNLKNFTIDNYDPLKYAEISNYNGSVLVALEIASDGSAIRETLYENKGWCYDPQPFNILLEKNNSLLLRMINNEKERFDVLKIN